MTRNNRKTGKRGEEIAVAYLKQNGFAVLETNYYTRFGEIDIVATEGDCLVFTEVKYRRDGRCGMPAESVSITKMKKICSSARVYLMMHHINEDCPIRFDVVSILGEEITLIRNAFEAI